jgi:hypothetical protein
MDYSKVELYFSLCTATNPCRFKLLMKCSQGITRPPHSLCYYPCKFSPYLSKRALHSALSYIRLSCPPDVIFRLSTVFFLFPAHTSQRTQPVSVVVFSLSPVSSASRREHYLHYQNHWCKSTNIYTWSAYNFCPNYIKPECVLICW